MKDFSTYIKNQYGVSLNKYEKLPQSTKLTYVYEYNNYVQDTIQMEDFRYKEDPMEIDLTYDERRQLYGYMRLAREIKIYG